MSEQLIQKLNIETENKNNNSNKNKTETNSNKNETNSDNKLQLKSAKLSKSKRRNKKWMDKAIRTFLEDYKNKTEDRIIGEGMEGQVKHLYSEHFDIMASLIDYYGDDRAKIEGLMSMYFDDTEGWRETLENLYNDEDYQGHKISINRLFQYAATYETELPEEDFEFDDNYVPKDETIDNFVLEQVLEGNYFVSEDTFYEYHSKEGYWKKRKDSEIKKIIADKLKDFYQVNEPKNGEPYPVYCFANRRTVNSCFSYAKVCLSLDFELSTKHLMAYSNGTVNLKTGKLQEPCKENYLTQLIPHNYVENAEIPPVFKDFLLSSYGEEQIEIIRSAIFMLVDPTAPFGKFIHIIGKSGSGKGTLLRLLQKMVGLENTISLENFGILASPDKRHQHLTNISLCIAPDVSGYQQNLQAFYELVDNGAMAGRALHSNDAYQKQWFIRFIMASVDILTIENSGEGWKRRCIPIHTKDRQNKENPNLENELTQELGEILGWALAMDKQKRDQILLSSELWSKKSQVLQAQQQVNGDSVASFIDSCLVPTEQENDVIEKNNLYKYYKSYCAVTRHKPQNNHKFFSRVESLVGEFCLDSQNKKINGKQQKIPKRMTHTKVQSTAFKQETLTGFTCDISYLSEGNLSNFLVATKKGGNPSNLVTDSQNSYNDNDVAVITNKSETGNPSNPSNLKPSEENKGYHDYHSEKTVTNKVVNNETPDMSETEGSGYHGYHGY